MIKFLSNWIEQIAIAVIIVSIFEMILPNGNLKKYIKVVLGIYIIFCLISPFVNSSMLYNIGDINLEEYIENVPKSKTEINQKNMDIRLQDLYIEELEDDIEKRAKEKGYTISKCNINADLNSMSDNPGIHKIDLTISKNNGKNINIEKIEINQSKTNETTNTETIEKLKEYIANHYEINKDIINIKVK